MNKILHLSGLSRAISILDLALCLSTGSAREGGKGPSALPSPGCQWGLLPHLST